MPTSGVGAASPPGPPSRRPVSDSIESHVFEQRHAPQQIGREGVRGLLTQQRKAT